MSDQNPWDFSDQQSQNSAPQPAPGGFGSAQPGFGQGGNAPFAASAQTPATVASVDQGPAAPFAPGADPFGQSSLEANTPAMPGVPAAFGESGPVAVLETSRPPVQWLFLAVGLAVVSIVVALLLGGMPPVAIAAWVVAGPIGIGALAFFTTTDLKARTGAVYLAQGWVKPMYVVALVLCFAGAIVAAWRIADWVGHL